MIKHEHICFAIGVGMLALILILNSLPPELANILAIR